MAVKAAFPLSLVVILSSVPFFIDLDILDIFQTAPIPFLPFSPGRPRICQGQNHPRQCLKTIWTFITRPQQYPSSARALSPNVKMGQGHKFLGPTKINTQQRSPHVLSFQKLEKKMFISSMKFR